MSCIHDVDVNDHIMLNNDDHKTRERDVVMWLKWKRKMKEFFQGVTS